MKDDILNSMDSNMVVLISTSLEIAGYFHLSQKLKDIQQR